MIQCYYFTFLVSKFYKKVFGLYFHLYSLSQETKFERNLTDGDIINVVDLACNFMIYKS